MSKFNIFLKNNTKVTPENFKILYDELRLMRNSSYLDKHENQCKEVIQLIIEYLIYGDKNDSHSSTSIFDLFCEYNFMNEFIHLASLNNRAINLQIIKSFSVLILNLTNATTLYYIFSNNFINQILSNDYEKYDEDFLSYYVNFIKSLSLKIDHTTIQFFFQKQFNNFPIVKSALKLYNHTDPMIKNVVRNIILTVLKIKYEPIINFFSSLPTISYFLFLALRLRDQVIKLNEEIISSDDQISLKSIHDDIIDDILYIQDIFSLKIEKINYILTNSLFYYFILPLLCGSLVSMTKPKIGISVAIYILLAIFYYIKDQSFINSIFTIIFSDKSKRKILMHMEDYPKNLKNYFFDWSAQKKGKSLYSSFTNYIMLNFSEPFVKSLVCQHNSPYSEINSINKKYTKLLAGDGNITSPRFNNITGCKDHNTRETNNVNSPTFMKSFLEDIFAKFSNNDFDAMTNYHKNLSIATGVNIGLSVGEDKNDCVLKVLERMFTQGNFEGNSNNHSGDSCDNSNNLNAENSPTKLYKNEVRENLYSYLRSKDDTLILIVSLLIYTVHRKNISKELLSMTKLLKASDFAKSDYDTNTILNEIFSIDYFGEKNNTEKESPKNKNNDLIDFTAPDDPVNKEDNEEKIFSNNTNPNNNLNAHISLDAPDLDGNNYSNYSDINHFDFLCMNSTNSNTNNNLLSLKSFTELTPSFDNDFFYNLFSSHIQKMYDSDLLDNLLNLLMVEPPFRTITNRLILENITSLITKEEGFSFVDRGQLDILNKIYYTYLSNIKLIILNNKYIRETGFELFENEWMNYREEISHTVNELVSRPFILIPFNLEDTVEGNNIKGSYFNELITINLDYPKVLRIQKTEVDSFKSNLIIFMTLHDLRCKIYREGETPIKEAFPLKLGGLNLDINQTYNLNSLGLEIYPCKLRFSTSKNYINYNLLIYQNHLFFALPDIDDPSSALIKYKYALRHLEAQFDRSDPRVLSLMVKDKNNYLDIVLFFDDVNKTGTVKKSFEEQRKSSRNTEYLLLNSYFDELISNWKF